MAVIDPLTNLISASDVRGMKSMLTRLIDYLKMQGITAMFTHLSQAGSNHTMESTEEGVSSLIDTWLLLRDIEHQGTRTYGIFVLKSRGMAHSHEIKQFRLTDSGIQIGELMDKSIASKIPS